MVDLIYLFVNMLLFWKHFVFKYLQWHHGIMERFFLLDDYQIIITN